MKGFLNKPVSDLMVFKAIAQHHFRMTNDHLEEFMRCVIIEKE